MAPPSIKKYSIRCKPLDSGIEGFYNKDGADAAGGIQIYDQDVEIIEASRQGDMYPGCFAEVAVTIGTYEHEDDEGETHNALKFYLSAVQKTRDGENLRFTMKPFENQVENFWFSLMGIVSVLHIF